MELIDEARRSRPRGDEQHQAEHVPAVQDARSAHTGQAADPPRGASKTYERRRPRESIQGRRGEGLHDGLDAAQTQLGGERSVLAEDDEGNETGLVQGAEQLDQGTLGASDRPMRVEIQDVHAHAHRVRR